MDLCCFVFQQVPPCLQRNFNILSYRTFALTSIRNINNLPRIQTEQNITDDILISGFTAGFEEIRVSYDDHLVCSLQRLECIDCTCFTIVSHFAFCGAQRQLSVANGSLVLGSRQGFNHHSVVLGCTFQDGVCGDLIIAVLEPIRL